MKRAFASYIPRAKYDVIVIGARWYNGQSDYIPDTIKHAQKFAKQVYVIGNPMEWKEDLPAILARGSLWRRSTPTVALGRYAEMTALDAKIAGLVPPPTHYISLFKMMCPGECKTAVDNAPIQSDYGHLTFEGAKWLIAQLRATGRLDLATPNIARN